MTEERRSADGMLGKGLRLLVVLGDHPDGARVSQLARDVAGPVSTAHRLLARMVPLGFVSFARELRPYAHHGVSDGQAMCPTVEREGNAPDEKVRRVVCNLLSEVFHAT